MINIDIIQFSDSSDLVNQSDALIRTFFQVTSISHKVIIHYIFNKLHVEPLPVRLTINCIYSPPCYINGLQTKVCLWVSIFQKYVITKIPNIM